MRVLCLKFRRDFASCFWAEYLFTCVYLESVSGVTETSRIHSFQGSTGSCVISKT